MAALAKLGYAHNASGSQALREAVSDIPWFRRTLMQFDRIGGPRPGCDSEPERRRL